VSLFHDSYDISYPPPRKSVLLVTCMDLRLIDDIVQFMDHDNLTNRYDHVTMAGCALGALGANGHHPHWEETFRDHFRIAYQLRQFGDVYVIEHRDCGAYRAFLGDEHGVFDDTAEGQHREAAEHAKHCHALAARMKAWAKEDFGVTIQVRAFLMNLRGHVDALHLPPPPPSRRKKG
jgi:carbonic anhydrase